MEIVTGLAWPIVVLASVIVLRRQLAQLVGRMTHLRAPGGVEATFSQRVEAASDLAEAAVPDPPQQLEVPNAGPDERPAELRVLLDLARVIPRAGIDNGWTLARGAAYGLFEALEIPDSAYSRQLAVVHAARTLRRLGSSVGTYPDLTGIATRLTSTVAAIDDKEVKPTPEDAYNFVEAAWRLFAVFVDAQGKVEEQHKQLLRAEDEPPLAPDRPT